MNHCKELKTEEIKDVLQRGEYAVLAITDGNEPYALSLCYGMDKDKLALYFLTDKGGLKLDFLKSNPYVCGTVVIQNPGKEGSPHGYRSVVFRGVMEVIHDPTEQATARLILEEGSEFHGEKREVPHPMVMKLEWDEISGRNSC
ncbi:MAG: hypothetical protein B6241_02715 [Spirochaetaceae bacterium 4572_59]|nr:MAG: hypothetical protein B6241_02715 [Spirochaetaceae bacterium 4572_59]